MKKLKLLSLSAAVLMSAMAFAQDTIPPVKKSLPDPATLDTLPKSNKINPDTSLLNPGIKIPDTLMKKTSPDTPASANSAMPADTTSVSAMAKEPAPTAMDDSTTVAKPAVEDKVVMTEGKMFVVKGGDSTVLVDSIVLKNGTIVKKDATVIFKDGTTAKLTAGQSIVLAPAEKEVAKTTPKAESAPKPATPPSAPTATDSASTTKTTSEDKVVMVNDKIMVVRNGDSTLLADSIKLESGAVVKSDATVRFKNGKTTKLKNGQFINLKPEPATEAKKTKEKATPKKKAKG